MNIVGALLFVAVMTRPDIAYHTSMLSKFMSDPTLDAYDLAINLLLYLAHNPAVQLTYDGHADVPHALGKDGKNPLLKHRDSIVKNGGFIAYSVQLKALRESAFEKRHDWRLSSVAAAAMRIHVSATAGNCS